MSTPSEQPEPSAQARLAQIATAVLVVVFALVVLRTAWLSEDAYFTYRSVENWVHGHGARWNVLERVQVYTHPLWFGLMSALYFVTRHMAASAFALCFSCTGATVYVLVRHARGSWGAAALAMGVLIASKAFTDYSTSGLENPLSHLLLVALFARFWADEELGMGQGGERRLVTTWLLGGLLVCNRMDLGLILVPALIYSLWPPRLKLRRILAIGLGFAPLIVWELISLVYYGFLVPNTAYAKLGSGIPSELLIEQGHRYFANSIDWDPITLSCIALVSLLGLLQLRTRPRQACAALGVLLYLAYVRKIGGDYMSGRFFTAPLVVSAALIANWKLETKPAKIAAGVGGVATVVLAFLAPNPTLLAGADYTDHMLLDDQRVDDERGYRHFNAGLISTREVEFLHNSGWYQQGLRDRRIAAKRKHMILRLRHNGGYMGYAAGPMVHYVNSYAITDPLLARLPGSFQAAGHIARHIPRGYLNEIKGKGEIPHPELAAYWDELLLIIRGPIWSRARWGAIWRMHNGESQELIETYLEDYRAELREAAKQPPTVQLKLSK